MEEKRLREGALAPFLPSYEYSPWKTGRSKEEQKELREIEKITIEDGIETLGNYTFYGCRNLKTLAMTDSVKSIGGGSFTGCGALRNLEMLMEENSVSCIKDVVSETFHEVYVSIRFRNTGKRAELIFPEYYEEGVENTPARILETKFHGCGYKYRQCFTDKKVDFKKYDSLFSEAVINEKPEIVVPLAMGRLLYPYELMEKGKKEYETYIKEHMQETGIYYLEKDTWHEVFSFLAEEKIWSEEGLDSILKEASVRNLVSVVSFLMEKKRELFAPKEKSFDL